MKGTYMNKIMKMTSMKKLEHQNEKKRGVTKRMKRKGWMKRTSKRERESVLQIQTMLKRKTMTLKTRRSVEHCTPHADGASE